MTTKNTTKLMIAAIAGILVVGTLAVGLPTAAFASQNANGGIGGAGGAGGVGGPGGINVGVLNGINAQAGNANGGSADGGHGGNANGGIAACGIFVFHC